MRKWLILAYLFIAAQSWAQLVWERVELANNPSVYVSPHNIIFAIGKDHTWLYRSFDEGATWDSVDMPRTHNDYPISGVDSSGTLYSMFWDSLYVSTDNGDNWKTITFPHSSPQSIFATNDTLYVLTYGPRVFHSADGAQTWTSEWISNGSDHYWTSGQSSPSGNVFGFMRTDGSVHLVSVFPSRRVGTKFSQLAIDNDPISWMMFDQEGFGYGDHNGMLIRSSDDGLTWQAIDSMNSEYRKRYWGPYGALKGGGIIAVSDTETVVSYDQTDTWSGIGEGVPTGYWKTFVTTRRGTIFIETDSGVFRTSHFAAVRHQSQQSTTTIGFDPVFKLLTVNDCESDSRLIVADVLGRIAVQKVLRGREEYRIDLSGIGSGTYLAAVISRSGTKSTMLSIYR